VNAEWRRKARKCSRCVRIVRRCIY
jgi:hypothetical protein